MQTPLDSGAPIAQNDSGNEAAPVLCDGSADVRFVYQAVGGGALEAGRVVMAENGWSLLVILGDCTYWTFQEAWEGIHHGALTAEEADSLASTMQIAKWGAWSGTWPVSACDGTSQFYQFGPSLIRVVASCGGASPSSAPFPFDPLELSRNIASVQTLLGSAPEVESTMRMILVRRAPDDPATYPPVPWPLARDPYAMSLSISDATNVIAGQSTLISLTDAALLRAVRDDYRNGKYPSWRRGDISFIGPDGTRYGAWYRDTMPQEDANGLLHLFQ